MSLLWRPQPLVRVSEPFDHPDWIYELKLDGFRALAYKDCNSITLVSRQGHVFRKWHRLHAELAATIRAKRAVLDGEVVCLRPDGNADFNALLFRTGDPYYSAFDLLSLNGRDLRGKPLHERKERLRDLLPAAGAQSRLRFVDHVVGQGSALYGTVCRADVEGIVGKWSAGTYHVDGVTTSWVKVKNREYSQVVGRRELFEQRRSPEGRRAPKPNYRMDVAAAVAW